MVDHLADDRFAGGVVDVTEIGGRNRVRARREGGCTEGGYPLAQSDSGQYLRAIFKAYALAVRRWALNRRTHTSGESHHLPRRGRVRGRH